MLSDSLKREASEIWRRRAFEVDSNTTIYMSQYDLAMHGLLIPHLNLLLLGAALLDSDEQASAETTLVKWVEKNRQEYCYSHTPIVICTHN